MMERTFEPKDWDQFYSRFKQGTEKKLVITVHRPSNKESAVKRCYETEYGIHWKELWWEGLCYHPLAKFECNDTAGN